ncbi:MAG: DUF975 family protein [Lachnospiraceae bacterium]|nr:DUF975 family protein [Lachnospiraceae bacterium]
MNKFKSSAELKALAKEHMLGKYGVTIGATLVMSLIIGFVSMFSTIFLDTTTIIGLVLNFLISFVISVLTGLFTSGETYFFLKIACGKQVTFSDIFYGFKLFPNKAVLIQLYITSWLYIAMLPMTIFSYLVQKNPTNAVLMLFYSLALILYLVVAVIISVVYSQAFYLLHDFPNYSVKELLVMSRKIMKGSMGRYFYLTVSFIPLTLLGILSCGIVLFWIIPYMNATYAEFFLDLMKKKQ